MKTKICYCVSVFLLLSLVAHSATYYVDSNRGDDRNDGVSPETPWKSVGKVNGADILPGDRILFARGGLWRTPIVPHSGSEGNPVYYGAYGEGPLPKFYGSIDASREEDWKEIKPGIWSTQKVVPVLGKNVNEQIQNGVVVQGDNRWNLYCENGATASLKTLKRGLSLMCSKSGSAANHIQIWGPSVDPNIPMSDLQVVYRVRCTKPWNMPQMTIQGTTSPWAWRYSCRGAVSVTDSWQEVTAYMKRWSEEKPLPKEEKLRYHLSLGTMPAGATFELEIIKVTEAQFERSRFLYCDVGNIIFDHGQKKSRRCGVKKWSLDACRAPGDYWYDGTEKLVFLRWDKNPGKEFESIELALRAHIINQSGCHDVVYENLAVAYGAAHGFGGEATQRIVIRKCDIYYIGGGHQLTRPNGQPVRFGNGIEFWGDCDRNLVEECRLWEIYDAALTNQGRKDRETNIIYRKNVIWNSEYSFEYWNAKYTDNILFEDNICVDAGFGWGHDQRPDPNGAHLMFYNNRAQTTNFVIRNNVFSESTDVCIRMENDWRSGLTLEGNKYYQSSKPILRWRGKTYYGKDDLKKIALDLGMEKTGIMLEKPWRIGK